MMDLRDLTAGLAALSAEIEGMIDPTEAAIADLIVEQSAANAPVQTGALRDSHHRDGNRAVADAPHAVFVHENPEGRDHHYMDRALDELDEAARDAAARLLGG